MDLNKTFNNFSNTQLFENAMSILTESILSYLKYQVSCGAKAIQIFDSWVGVLSLEQYKRHVFPHMKHLVQELKSSGIPVILYSQPTLHLLPALLDIAPTALSVDWRTNIADLVKTVKALNKTLPTIQGNLDPLVTTLDWDDARPYVQDIVDQVLAAGIRKQFVFNVGHGVVPETKWETLQRTINFVHEC
jgi:uroporphyrinogen decarboxylase